MSVPHVDESDEYSVEEIGLSNCHNHIALAENILGGKRRSTWWHRLSNAVNADPHRIQKNNAKIVL